MATTAGTSVRAFAAKEGCQAHLPIDLASNVALVVHPHLDQVYETLAVV